MKSYLRRCISIFLITILILLIFYVLLSISFEMPLVLKRNVNVKSEALNRDIVHSIVSEEYLDFVSYGCYDGNYLFMKLGMPNWIYNLWMKPPRIYLLVDTNQGNDRVTMVYFIGEDLTISKAICEYVGSSEISINEVFY